MTRGFVSSVEFQRYLVHTKYGELTKEQLASYCDYLEDKTILENGKDAEIVFLSEATKKANYSPYYAEETEEYIKSKEFSNKIKKYLLDLLKDSEEYKTIKKALSSNIDMNDIDISILNKIHDALERVKEKGNEEPLELFKRYMFVLDGDDAVLYIRKEHSFIELALEFLDQCNIDKDESKKIGNGLLVEYMMSIYRMYKKYLPNYLDNYLRFIKQGNFLSQKEFAEDYIIFVKEGFVVKKEIQHSINPKQESIKDIEERINNSTRISTRKIFLESIDSLESDEALESIVKRLIYTLDSKPKNGRNQQPLDKIA